jgi:hypothetical protein
VDVDHPWIMDGSMDQCSKEKWRLKAPYFDGENPWQPSIVPSTNLLTVGVRGDTSKSWAPKKNRSNTKHTRGFIGEGITVPGLIKTRWDVLFEHHLTTTNQLKVMCFKSPKMGPSPMQLREITVPSKNASTRNVTWDSHYPNSWPKIH